MNATERLEALPALRQEIDKRRAHLSNEIEQTIEEWEGLGRASGQRDDHAATYLCRIRDHIDEFQRFAAIVSKQLTDSIENPFGRE